MEICLPNSAFCFTINVFYKYNYEIVYFKVLKSDNFYSNSDKANEENIP